MLKNSSATKCKLLCHNKCCCDNKTVLFSNTQMEDHMQNKLQGFFFLLAICANWKESQHPPLDFPKISTENPTFFCLVPLADGIWVPVLKRIAGQGWGGGGMDLTPLMNKVNLTLISGRNKIPINCQVLEGFTTTHTSSCCWQESESNTPHTITPLRTHFLGTGKTPFTLTIKCAVNEASRLTLHVTDVSVRACMLSHFRHVRLSVTP